MIVFFLVYIYFIIVISAVYWWRIQNEALSTPLLMIFTMCGRTVERAEVRDVF